MTDHPLTETHADPHHDPRPWQDCTREDIREGDRVESLRGDILCIGVAHYQDEDGDWWTEDNFPLTWGDFWPIRRIPATPTLDPLAENYGKVLRDVEMEGGDKVDVAILAGPKHLLADWGNRGVSMPPARIAEFTTDGRTTRYTRHGGTWAAKTLNGDTNG